MRASITIVGNDLFCRRDPGRRGEDVRIALTRETLSRLHDWAGRYDRAVRSGDPSLLLGLGSEMWTWLDGNGWALAWANGAGDRTLEIAVDDSGSAAARVLLDVPWAHMARTSFTSVGSSADSPEPPLRPLPVTGDAAEILDV
jgi:hypothetical protein